MKVNCTICNKEFDKPKGDVNRTKGNYCSEECISEGATIRSKAMNDKRYSEYVVRWKQGLESGMKGKTQISGHIRRYLLDKYDNKCSECSWDKINIHTNKIPLEVEHIDGIHTNNKEDNLTILCPNCHSLTSTYRALNKGNGRPRG